MGSSDLNLKKSWHVGRAANISAIAKAEADAIAERKKLAQRLNEIKEERKKEEIQKQLAAAGGKPVTQRVEWMYSGGPGDGQNGDSVANEAFLLGKRTLDKLLVSQDNELKELQKQTSRDTSLPAQNVNTARDTAAKIREDPLLAIRRSEAEAYGAMMNDPIKRRQLLASMGIDDSKQSSKHKEERRHRHKHHHRRRHRDDDSDDEGRSRKRRRSDSRDPSRSPRRYDSEDEDRHRRRRRSSIDRRSRSRTRNEKSRYDSEDEDRRRRRRPSTERYASKGEDRRREGRRPPTERYGSEDGDRRRERRGPSTERRRASRTREERRREDARHSRHRERSRSQSPPRRRQDDSGADDARARKLAAMQAAASNLDQDREARLTALDHAERAAREADDKARQRSSKVGGDRHFLNGLHRKAGDMDLAERIGRGRQGLQRDED